MTVDTRRKTAYAVASSIQEILWWSRKHARMCPRVNPDGVPDTELLSRIAKALTDAGWNPFTEAQAVQWAREFPHITRK